MTNSKFRNILTSVLTVTSLVLASGAVATIMLGPDAAYAKNDKSNGNGKGPGRSGEKGKSGKGNDGTKGGKGKSGKGHGAKSADKDAGGAKFNTRRSGKAFRFNKNQNAKSQRSAKNKNKGQNSKVRETTLAGFGREFKRDVEQLFGKRTRSKSNTSANRVKKSYRQASVAPLEHSPRPVARTDYYSKRHVDKKPGARRYRDPLVAAITDPYGSDKLRNLNASKAAAPAFRNASANSNVGKIATYQAAAETYYDLRDDLYEARRELRDLNESYDGRSSEDIADDIAALDPADPNYEDDLNALEDELRDAEAYEEARDNLRADVRDLRYETRDALQDAETAFYDASKGRTLTKATLGEFHGNLDLPQPGYRHKDWATIQPVPYDPDDYSYSEDKTFYDETDYRLRYDKPYFDRKKDRYRYYRDPLVAAITDPYGSDKLRNLNASKAAAPAFRNASANSNVGKIATYQAAAETYYDLRGDLYEARRELRDLNESYDGRSSEDIADDIAALDPADPNYEDDLSALEDELRDAETYEEARDDLRADVRDLRYETRDALQDAEAAFYDASKGRTLTKATLGEFHGYLDLPQPGYRHKDWATIQPVPYDPDDYSYSDDKTFYDETDYRLRYDKPYSDRKKDRYRYYRDPLVAAITDPYGSDKLRNLNASKAAAPAFRNASANSNVGKIATYQAAAETYYDLRGDLYEARRELRDLNESYDGRSSEDIADDIAALDPADPNYEDDLSALEDELRDAETYEEARDDLRADVRDLRIDTLVAEKEAEHAFFEASKGAALTKQLLSEFHSNLQLPTPSQ
ncbi:hypothetical protein [Ruegeria conchae]|uniref:Uncharacterized protein n=2 Tax=Ruegeria conchae TaxID=981384 RepID=A0A497ZNM6_9RHOB|nr:hypothetical protein [Ruegeria conchae]RLK10910.1 hypothetical protein CLV75_0898 [Ruegeria conchae]